MNENGNKEGTTELAHKTKPFLAAFKLELEKTTRHIVKKTNIKGKIKFFNFTILNLYIIETSNF